MHVPFMDRKVSWLIGCLCRIYNLQRVFSLSRISSYPKWKPVDLYAFLERFGSLRDAMIPAPSANIDARANAGMFPPPNKASHGPAPSETTI